MKTKETPITAAVAGSDITTCAHCRERHAKLFNVSIPDGAYDAASRTITTLCAACLLELADAIFPYRAGAGDPRPSRPALKDAVADPRTAHEVAEDANLCRKLGKGWLLEQRRRIRRHPCGLYILTAADGVEFFTIPTDQIEGLLADNAIEEDVARSTDTYLRFRLVAKDQ